MTNSTCLACIAKRLHTLEEIREYHPYSGHGKSGIDAINWTHKDLGERKMTFYTADETSIAVERRIVELMLADQLIKTDLSKVPTILHKYEIRVEVTPIP